MKFTNTWYSVIQYRPDPSDPDRGCIPLGVALEATGQNLWIVGVYVRAFLTAEELSTLDGIGRELLTHPDHWVEQSVQTVLVTAQRPGDVLVQLSRHHPWSIHITEPKTFEPKPTTDAPFRQMAEDMAMYLYTRFVVDPRVAEPSASDKPRTASRRTPKPSRVSPRWAHPPHVWEMPAAAAAGTYGYRPDEKR